jgi:hypothetical protein
MEFAHGAGEIVEIFGSDKRNGTGSCEDTYNLTEKKQSYALDYICYSAGAVAAWAGQFIHARRVHSHPARDRDCGADNPIDLRSPRVVTSMKPAGIIGIILIVIGILALVYGGITYTKRERVLDLGPIQATAEKQKTIPFPPVLGGICLVGGIVLVIVGGRKT